MDTDSWGPHRGSLWAAGPWTAELRGDEIADLRHGGVFVLRSIRAVVRDADWRTVPVTVQSSNTSQDGLTTTLALRYDGLGIDAHARLALYTDGDRFDVQLSLTAVQGFDTNRTGLVVLHPPLVAGAPLSIGHGDGAAERAFFPERISAHQPAFDIAELRWSFGGLDLVSEFSGDTFEMEDQRNWTDASFKTYSRPLALPFPYRIDAGAVISQRIRITASSASRTGDQVHPASSGAGRRLQMVDAGRPAPRVGVGAAPASIRTSSMTPPADFVFVELHTRDADHESTAALERAKAAGLPLDVRIIADEPAAVEALVKKVAAYQPVRLGIFSTESHVTEPELWHALVAATRAHACAAELVGGARSHFTELNREHHRLPAFPSYAISITPQMHARDTFQIEESIGLQRRVAADASVLAHGASLHIGPVTLRPRFNAVATTSRAPQTKRAIESDTIDERQSSPQLATWLVASAAALAEGGAASVTWFEERGPRGIYAADGSPYPVREAMAAIHALSGLPLLVPALTSADDALTWVLGARTTHGVRLLVARLGDTATDVILDVDGQLIDVHLEPGSWRLLDVPANTHDDPKES